MGTNLLVKQSGTTYTDTGIALTAGSPPPPVPYDVAVIKSNSNMVRARVLPDNTLEIAYSLTGNNITWSIATWTGAHTAHAGYLPALVAYPNNTVDVFWIDADGITMKTATSADDGQTFTTAAMFAVNRAVSGGTICLAAPAANIIFWTDTNNGLVVVRYRVKGASWTTNAIQTWDFSPGVSMGIESPATVLGAGSALSSFSMVQIASGDYLMCFYSSAPRGEPNFGVFTCRVTNVAATSAMWRSINPVHIVSNVASSFSIQGSGLALGFPKIQIVGSEYWITCLEHSSYAGNSVQHLCYLRSADGVHWSDREYIAGSDLTYNSGGSSFSISDMIYSQLLVFANRLFLYAYDKVFRAQSTSMVGVTNTAMQVDLTNDVPSWSLSLPSNGAAGQGRTELQNPDGKYNNHSILRRGSRLLRSFGYVTAGPTYTDLLQIAVEYVDEIRQSVANGKNALEISTRDGIKSLMDWVSDIYYEYFSGFKLNIGLTGFTSAYAPTTTSMWVDTTPVAIFNGSWFIDPSSKELHPGMIDTNSTYTDNMCIINSGTKSTDGILEIRMKCIASWSAPAVYFGAVFQCTDNLNYYAVFYNKTTDKWTIERARPTVTSDNSSKILQYCNEAGTAGSTIALSDAGFTLNTNTYYWIRFQKWHDTLNVYISTGSTERKTWTKVTWGGGGSNSGLTIKEGYWGLVSTGNLSVSAPIGNTAVHTAGVTTDPAAYVNDRNKTSGRLGKRMDWAMRFNLSGPGVSSGILRGISIEMTKAQTGGSAAASYIPDTVIALVADNGTGNFPDCSTVLYSTTVGQASFPGGITSGTVPYSSFGATSSVSLVAGTYYWVWVYSSGNVSLIDGTTVYPPNAQSLAGDLIDFLYIWGAPTGGGSNFKTLWTYLGNATPAAADWQDLSTFVPYAGTQFGANGSLNINLSVSLLSNGPVISALNFSSGETPKTVEWIANDIVAKAGVLNITADSQITDAFGSALGNDGDGSNWAGDKVLGTWAVGSGQLSGQGADATHWGFLRSNTSKGTFGDIIVDCDMTLMAAGGEAGFLLRNTGSPSLTTASGYVLTVLDATQDVCNMYYLANNVMNKLFTSPLLVGLPAAGTQFHVTVSNNAGYYQVFINDILAASWQDTTFLGILGYVGFAAYGDDGAGGPAAKFDNYRIPDISKVKPYFSINARESAKSSLDRLVKKGRIQYFMRNDGTLRIAQFNGRSSVDTYSWQMQSTKKVDSDRDWASHIQPEGNFYADRFDANLIDSDGRRFSHQDYTDAQTDAQAYADASLPIRYAEEQSNQYETLVPFVPALEREDVLTLTATAQNTDNTNKTYIAGAIDITVDAEQAIADAQVELRQFVS